MKKSLRRVYVWEYPVRFFHWINVVSIVVLCITGYVIANPPAILSIEEASFGYWFGIFRFIHFGFAYIFIANYIVRVYWAFKGNQYAHWRNFVPTSFRFIREIFKVLIYDIFLKKDEEHVAFGHNALAGFSYFLLFLAFLVQCVTGFGLYAAMSDWWLPNLFAWVPAVTGGEVLLRQIHHIFLWVFIVFSVIHLYLVLFHDYVEGRGETSSMIGGWKFIEEKILEEEQHEGVLEKEPHEEVEKVGVEDQ